MHGVIRSKVGLHALEQAEEVEEEVPCSRVLDLERDALLGRVVCTWRTTR